MADGARKRSESWELQSSPLPQSQHARRTLPNHDTSELGSAHPQRCGQGTVMRGELLIARPFWATSFILARGFTLQRLRLFSIRPRLPPSRFILNRVTGASGTERNRVRTRSFTESLNPTRVTRTGPLRSATRSGSSRSSPLERK